jgi:hypothetical protein
MLREFINKPLLKRARTCESCGDSFECEIGLKGCWCSKLDLSDEQRTNLAAQYNECLCRKCLESVARKV